MGAAEVAADPHRRRLCLGIAIPVATRVVRAVRHPLAGARVVHRIGNRRLIADAQDVGVTTAGEIVVVHPVAAKTDSPLEEDKATIIAANPTAAVDQPARLPLSKSVSAFSWLRANAASALIALWTSGVLSFACLAFVDRYRLRQLVASARAPGDALIARYSAMASSLGIRRIPRLVVTDDLESPALAGVFSPVVLIPAWLTRENASAKLAWALKHELMHWKLLDPLANFVRELAQILFYFHPAVWWVGRKWEEAAELACDRAIVASEADSHDYAEQLYQMLVVVRDQRRLRLSTGLFATRTQIGRRIAALLAAPLNVPSHLNVIAISAVVAFSALTLSVGAGFAERTAERVPANTADAVAPPGEAQHDAKPARAEPKPGEQVVISGQVVDPEGKPVSNARLWLEYKRLTQPAAELGPRYSTTSGPDGQFRFSFPKSELTTQSRDDYWNSARVIATAAGFGFDEAVASKELAAKPLTLTLAKDTTIRGRILDIEGRPVAGASVRVKDIRWTPGQSLDAFLAESRDARPLFRFGRISSGALAAQPLQR